MTVWLWVLKEAEKVDNDGSGEGGEFMKKGKKKSKKRVSGLSDNK